MLEMIIEKEIELVQEIANVNAAERVHLRERQNTGEPIMIISVQCSSQKERDIVSARKLLYRPIWREPANVDHFLVVTEGVDGHRHIVISRNNLSKTFLVSIWPIALRGTKSGSRTS